MDDNSRYTRMECNDCHRTFDISEAKEHKLKISKTIIQICPHCGGSIKLNALPTELDKYLFVNNDERYYIYENKGEN